MTDVTRAPSGQGGTDPQRSGNRDQYDLRADEQRRRVVATLDGLSTLAGIEAVARSLVARAEADPEDGPDDRLERLAIELHPRHLPKLAGAGLVGYDPDALLVEDVAADGLPRRESGGV